MDELPLSPGRAVGASPHSLCWCSAAVCMAVLVLAVPSAHPAVHSSLVSWGWCPWGTSMWMQTLCLLWWSDLALRASQDVKKQFSLLPTPFFILANFSEQIQRVLCGEKLYYISSIDADFKIAFTISSWKEYLGTGSFFSRQGFRCVCRCCLMGGQVKGTFLMCSLFKGCDSHKFHHAGCTHPPPSQLAYSRAFLAIKQGLSILSFSELWRWWIESQWGPGPVLKDT